MKFCLLSLLIGIALIAQADDTLQEPPSVSASTFVTSSDGTLIAVQESGSPIGRPILFIHGFSHNSAVWFQQIASPALSRYHLVTMDLRGHGYSGKPTELSAYSDPGVIADDVNAVIQQRHLLNPIVVGWSLGGIVLTDYLLKYGDSAISGIDLVDSIICPNSTCQQTIAQEIGSLQPLVDLLSNDAPTEINGISGFVNLEAGGTPTSSPLTPQQLQVLEDIMLTTPEFARINFIEGATAAFAAEPDLLQRLKVPVLIQHGQDDPIFPSSFIPSEVSLIKKPTVHLYSNTGHIVFFLTPRQFNLDLAAWIQSTQNILP